MSTRTASGRSDFESLMGGPIEGCLAADVRDGKGVIGLVGTGKEVFVVMSRDTKHLKNCLKDNEINGPVRRILSTSLFHTHAWLMSRSGDREAFEDFSRFLRQGLGPANVDEHAEVQVLMAMHQKEGGLYT